MESLALGQVGPISFLVSSSPYSQDEHPGMGSRQGASTTQ